MKFKFIKSLLFVLIFLIIVLACDDVYAINIYMPDEVVQGSTLELLIPKGDITEIYGTFDGRDIKFFKIQKEPNWDEKITRAEFLKLMFENYDFGEIDSSEAVQFPDVPKTNPFYEYIQKASALDIIHGYEDGYFKPYTPITRGQTAKILVRAFDPPNENFNGFKVFTDVPKNHRFYEYINRAIKIGYFKGYPDGLMRPDRNINYDEAEIIIRRAISAKLGTNLLKEFKNISSKSYFHAFIGIHRLSVPGNKILNINYVTASDTENISKEIKVLKRDFPIQSFTLPETKTKLLGKEEQNNTWSVINNAKKTTSTEKLWNGPFIIPTEGTITLGFGDKVYINGVFSGSHFGIDYANKEGTKIYASNSGKVVLAEETISYGNTIIIDHGQNIFTMYLHMSELKVRKGDFVDKGDLIGLMGETGVATGPHLHFNHFVGDVIVDSQEWFEGKF
jgi:hypothetical protein